MAKITLIARALVVPASAKTGCLFHRPRPSGSSRLSWLAVWKFRINSIEYVRRNMYMLSPQTSPQTSSKQAREPGIPRASQEIASLRRHGYRADVRRARRLATALVATALAG